MQAGLPDCCSLSWLLPICYVCSMCAAALEGVAGPYRDVPGKMLVWQIARQRRSKEGNGQGTQLCWTQSLDVGTFASGLYAVLEEIPAVCLIPGAAAPWTRPLFESITSRVFEMGFCVCGEGSNCVRTSSAVYLG